MCQNTPLIDMADKLRPDELAAFKAAFDMFDKNQDGTISTKVRKPPSHAQHCSIKKFGYVKWLLKSSMSS